jgi:hypothetical protein
MPTLGRHQQLGVDITGIEQMMARQQITPR